MRNHPNEVQEIAEAYWMGKMAPPESTVFEEHYTRCMRCARAVEDVARYIDAMRGAAGKLRPWVPPGADPRQSVSD